MPNFILLLLVLIYAPLANATLQEVLFGASPRTKAMGQAGSAASTDYGAVYYNPALLNYCPANLVSIGYNFSGTSLYFEDVADPQLDGYPGQFGTRNLAMFGACIKLPFHLTLGFYADLSPTTPVKITLQTINPSPQFVMYAENDRMPTIMGGFSFQIIDGLAVGMGVGISLNAVFAQQLVIPELASNKEMSLYLNAGIHPTFSIHVGASYDPISVLRIGLAYRSVVFGKLEAPVNTQVDLLNRYGVDLAQFVEGVYGFSPGELALGLAYKPLNELTLTGDIVWQHWELYPGPFLRVSPTEQSALSKVLAYPSYETATFTWAFVPRIGVEYVIAQTVAIRAGYSYRPTPLAMPTGTTNLLDNDVHTITAGGGYSLAVSETVKLIFDIYGSIGIMANASVDNPNGVDPYKIYSFGGVVYDTGLNLTLQF